MSKCVYLSDSSYDKVKSEVRYPRYVGRYCQCQVYFHGCSWVVTTCEERPEGSLPHRDCKVDSQKMSFVASFSYSQWDQVLLQCRDRLRSTWEGQTSVKIVSGDIAEVFKARDMLPSQDARGYCTLYEDPFQRKQVLKRVWKQKGEFTVVTFRKSNISRMTQQKKIKNIFPSGL